MRRILVTGAGGSPAVNFTRSLRLSGEDFYIVGVDSDKYCLQRAETNERYLVPSCCERDYLTVLNHIIRRTGSELLYSQPDVEIALISECREEIACRTFLPSKESVRILQNKFASFQKWQAAGLRVPRTSMINSYRDLQDCFKQYGPKIWLREIQGAFGKGALPTSDITQAKAWLDFHDGWGRFCGAECLEPQSVTWQSIWKNGELIVAQSRRRLYWEFANRAPSGITGLTGTGVTMADEALDDLAVKAIAAIDAKPTGIWSVDMTMDRDGIPNPTEINIGRFFTTHLFFSKAGLNMPLIFVKTAFNEPMPQLRRKINPLPVGLAWIRGMDFEPILTTEEKIDEYEAELQTMRRQIHATADG
jgi:hypothetical protein